jgi:hypothetical protein
MNRVSALLVVVIIVLSGCGQKKTVKPTMVAAPVAAIHLDPDPPYRDLFLYSLEACNADWNQTCQGYFTLDAPSGYQICKFLDTVTTKNNGFDSFTPANFYSEDTGPIRRFNSYGYNIGSTGSGNILDRWGGSFAVVNLGIRIIPSNKTLADKQSLGCDMGPNTTNQ